MPGKQLVTWIDNVINETGYIKEHAAILDDDTFRLHHHVVEEEDVLAMIDMIRRGLDYVENLLLLDRVSPR